LDYFILSGEHKNEKVPGKIRGHGNGEKDQRREN
jgi:hypothetical protein